MLLDKLEQFAWIDYLDLELLKPKLLTEEEKSTQNYLEEELESAREEWRQARQYFDLVADPDLVEHAIYSLEAAEKKYNYLLKKKKKQATQQKQESGREEQKV